MEKEGKHIYCIIKTSQDRNFGAIGIGGEDVLTVGYNDLSMVVSNHMMVRFVVDRENMIGHERVIEEVMKEFDSVLPVRFGTVAASADEIRNLLDRRYREFKIALREVEHKVELGVKGLWENMDGIFAEILEENKKIKKAKDLIQNGRSEVKQKVSDAVQFKMEVGKQVFEALQKKKERESEAIINNLRRTAVDHKLNKNIGDNMFMNASFLVDKGREKEFDNIMDDLGEEYKGRIKFMYAGPLPVFNFVNIAIYAEEWEK